MTAITATTTPESARLNDKAPEGDLREQLRLVMESDSRYTQTRVSKEIGLSAAVVSQWLANCYAGNNENVAAKVRQWLEAHFDKMANGGLPEAPKWIDTPISKQLLSTLRYAQFAGDVALIAGGPGLGKTTAIEHYARQMPNVWVATMRPSAGGVLHAVQTIAIALGLRKEEDTTGTAVYISRQVIKRLKGTNGLLVIDESQHLNVQAIEEIRSIHDAAQVGLAIVGNKNLYSRSSSGVNAPMLDRLLSRIGKRVTLDIASEADVDAVLGAWGVKSGECRKLLHAIAHRPGALRILTRVLRLALSLAHAEGKPLCCEHVKAAWGELGGAQ